MRNYIKSETINPYPKKDFTCKRSVKITQDALSSEGLFTSEITGEFGNRKAYITTGYIGDDSLTNNFVVSEDTLEEIIDNLQYVLANIKHDKELKSHEDSLMDTLHEYIRLGYVEGITLERLNMEIPGFNSSLYKVFKIKPKFIYNIDPNAGVNLEFSFIKCLHLDLNQEKYNKTIDDIRNGDNTIPIKFIGYDRKEEIKKFIISAKKELEGYDPSNNIPPTPEQINSAKDIMKKIGLIK